MLLVGAVLLAVFVLPSPWGTVAVATAAVVELAEVFFWVWLSKRASVRVGPEALIGARGQVVVDCKPEGQVRVEGELWRARCEAGAGAGERVRITALEGLTLVVEPDVPAVS